MAIQEKSSWQILRTMGIIGGSSLIVVIFRIVRMKVFAVLLGPAGVGLIGIYQSIMSTAGTISGMGVPSSGVRQIAEANGTGDVRGIANALFTLRWITVVLAVGGALGLFLLREPVSRWTFGNDNYITAVAVISIGVLFTIVSGSQRALLNGLRRISNLARINVISSFTGTIVVIIIVWLLCERGIVYAVVALVLVTVITSWWYVRQVPRPRSKPSWPEVKTQTFSLLGLGLAFMLSSLMIVAALLLVRVIILDRFGMVATGYFQAAWGIAVLYIDFILKAMGTDFYPHLTACIKDQAEGNRLVNEQTEVALLLGGPLIIGMITFAPFVIQLLYSAEFRVATEILRWQMLGNILKITSWPLGYIIMAQAWGKTFFFTELLWTASYVGGVYLGSRYYGINIVGYAFCASYLIYLILLYVITNRFQGFTWARMNIGLTATLFTAGVSIMVATSRNVLVGYLVGGLLTFMFGVFSLRKLYAMVETGTIKQMARSMWMKIKTFARIRP